MATTLQGKKVAFLATDGVETSEYVEPRGAVENAGAQVHLISPKEGSILGFEHLDKGDNFTVDLPVAEANADDYDALVLPGGVINADHLRMDRDAIRFVRSFFAAGKPVGVICHGPWIMIEADVVQDRTLTSYPSLRTDLTNAGATWVNEQVHVDAGLVSSRGPKDLPAFCDKLVEEISEGRHAEQRPTAHTA